MTDRRILLACAFLRALGTGMAGVLIGLYLAGLGLPPGPIGAVVGAGLAGAAVAALVAMLGADRVGRRRFLVAVSLIGAAGTAAVALASTPWVLGAAAFVGMLNGMGRDRGAALVIEQAVLPGTTSDAGRTRLFAWYNVLQDAGHALGSLAAGLPALLHHGLDVGGVSSMRAGLGLHAALLVLLVPLYLGLSPAVEIDGAHIGRVISPASSRVLRKVASLFALDSLGGGFLTTALLAYFFHERFGAGAGTVGLLFFGARVANALSHLGAAWLARRIGLVNTMVWTHVPSSLLLVTVAFAPSFPVAASLFLLREGLVEMDVPTRQSWVMAVVRPEERSFASGLTHLVRMGAWAIAPFCAGWFMEGTSLMAPLVVGAALKITYDVLLYSAFRGIRPPEERGPGSAVPG